MSECVFTVVGLNGGDAISSKIVIWGSAVPEAEADAISAYPDSYRAIGVGYVGSDNTVSIEIAEAPSEGWSAVLAQLILVDAKPVEVFLEEGMLPKSSILVFDELPFVKKTPEKPEVCADDCHFDLKTHEAIRQQLFLQCIRVTEPKVSTFPILDVEPISEDQFEKLQKILENNNPDLLGTTMIESYGSVNRDGLNHESEAREYQRKNFEKEGVDGNEVIRKEPIQVSSKLSAHQITADKIAALLPKWGSPTMEVGSAQIFEAHRGKLLAEILGVVNSAVEIPARYVMDCDTPLDWDESPTIVQACHPYFMHILEYRQEVVFAGSQAGSIVGSHTLSPCQEKQIATVSWKRNEENSRTENLTSSDQIRNSLSRSRNVQDLHQATVSEASKGSSKSHTASANVSASFPGAGAIIGVSGGYSQSGTSSSQSSSRNMAVQASQNLQDSTMQAAESIRSQTVTVVHAVSQGEEVTATTEVIKNYNKTRTLNFISREVLDAYDIRQRLTNVREAIAVPLRVSMFTESKVLRWRKELEDAMREKDFLPGFASIERIQNDYKGSQIPSGRFADAVITDMDGVLHVECRISRPVEQVPEDLGEISVWDWYLGHTKTFFSRAHYNRQLEHWIKAQDRNADYYDKHIAPDLAQALVESIRVKAVLINGEKVSLPIDPTALTRMDRKGRMQVSFNLEGSLGGITRADIRYVLFELTDGGASADIETLLPEGSELIIRSGRFHYSTAFSTGYLFRDGRIEDDLSGNDAVQIPTPLSTEELVSPLLKDVEYRNRLLRELNSNLLYYHEAIFNKIALDNPSMLRLLMDRVMVPEAGNKSVRTIMGDYVGAFDGCVIFYVAPGYEITRDLFEDKVGRFDLLNHYRPEISPEPIRVTLPTGTTHTQIYLGKCNLAETIDHSLNVNWLEPCESQVTAINPVSTETRKSEPTDLTAKDLSQPIINLQNAPQAPDYNGTDAMLKAISDPDIFRDMTGLSGTQGNTLAAYLQSQKSADAARSEVIPMAVAKMAEKEQALKLLDKYKSRLNKDLDKGDIDPDFYQEEMQNINSGFGKILVETSNADYPLLASLDGGFLPQANYLKKNGSSRSVGDSDSYDDGDWEIMTSAKDGVSDGYYHINHFIGYFDIVEDEGSSGEAEGWREQWKSFYRSKRDALRGVKGGEKSADLLYSLFVHIFNGANSENGGNGYMVPAFEDDKQWKGNPIIGFKLNVKALTLDFNPVTPSPSNHVDWVSLKNEGDYITGSTLRRKYHQIGDYFDPRSWYLGGANDQHFLAGRRAWKIGYDQNRGKYFFETAALERYSSWTYAMGDAMMRPVINTTWLNLLDSYSSHAEVVFADVGDREGYTKTSQNTYYRASKSKNKDDLLLESWFGSVVDRMPDLKNA